MIDINRKIMDAMKSHNKVASETYKLLKAKILEFKTAKNAKEYTESEEIGIIKKMISDMTNSMNIYLYNQRKDLADEEKAQIDVLQELLPPLPTSGDVTQYLYKNYPDGIDKKDMGKVIKEIKDKLVGVDGAMVAECVKLRLNL